MEPDDVARELRDRLRESRLTLLFTPELCGEREPLAVLEAALPFVDVVQVRIKHPEDPSASSPARALFDWTERVLELVAHAGSAKALVIVNDRVDVAACLEDRGVHGVHLGADDFPPELAREVLRPRSLIGLSTHSVREAVRAAETGAVDYLGFGPIFPTRTKGYADGLGPQAAWVAQSGVGLPIVPIGGIDVTNAADLSLVGRAAVSSAILGASDPGRAAREIRSLLSPNGD